MNIDDLLKSERARSGFSAPQREAMWKGVEIGVAAATPAAAPQAQAPSSSASTAASPANQALSTWTRAAALGTAVAIGAGLGALGHARWAAPNVVYVVRPAPAAESIPQVSLSSVPAPTSEATAAASAAPPPVPTTSPSRPSRLTPPTNVPPNPPAKDVALERERALLDMSRTALARGDAVSALASLGAHAREFPKGQLAEEREVLAIQALAATSRVAEAKARATAFHAAYPHSALRAIVDEATQ